MSSSSLGRVSALRRNGVARLYSTVVAASSNVASSTGPTVENSTPKKPPVNPFSPYFTGKRPPGAPKLQPTATNGTKPTSQVTGGRRRRPQISPENPKAYTRPIPKGIVPAYDLALRIIKEDSNSLFAEIRELEQYILELEAKVAATTAPANTTPPAAEEKDSVALMKEEIQDMRVKLGILRVQAKINDPATRWRVRNRLVNMSRPVDRHLVEQRWRDEGALDLLMQRIHQMNVVPDMLPELHPSLDLCLLYRTPLSRKPPGSQPKLEFKEQQQPGSHTTEQNDGSPENPAPSPAPSQSPSSTTLLGGRQRWTLVEPGVFLDSRQTLHMPTIRTKVFHPDTRLYTLLMVDYDVPDPEKQTFTSFLHWLQPNIPLSATNPGYDGTITIANDHTPYIPPHPQKGSASHRYVTLLLLQPSHDGNPYPPNGMIRDELNIHSGPRPLVCGTTPQSTTLDIAPLTFKDRLGFNLREFVHKHGFDPASAGGAHMFRAVWDEGVSKVIYPNILKQPEPMFGRPVKVNPVKATQTALSGSRYFPSKGARPPS